MSSILHLDHIARAWVVAHRLGWLNGVMLALSAIGRGGAIFAAIALLLSIVRRRARAFVQVGLAIACASLLSDSVIKPVVNRERPFVSTPQIAVLGARPKDASFPSGHSTNDFAGALSLTIVAPPAAAAWWTLAAAVAYSRVYVGVHYPGDVLAGALLGLLIAAAIARGFGVIDERRNPRMRASRDRANRG